MSACAVATAGLWPFYGELWDVIFVGDSPWYGRRDWNCVL